MARQMRVDSKLWNEFHRVINMSSQELLSWLRTCSPDGPDHAGPDTGQRVLHILQKRRRDLGADDEQAMRHVVDLVRTEHRDDHRPAAAPAEWRHRLMSIGHDPLRTAR